jgi:hypothetical protein
MIMRLIQNTLMLVLMAGLIFSCKKKEEEPTEVRNYAPAVPANMVALFHDDYNIDAPVLPVGTYETAIRFTTQDQSNVQNARLHAVQYYMASKPIQAQLRVYSGGTNNPGNLVYSRNIINEVERNKWNIHVLSDTLNLSNTDLWVGIRFTTNSEGKYIGCDPGPAAANGDWMWDALDASWLRYSNRTVTSINWNMRAVVEL